MFCTVQTKESLPLTVLYGCASPSLYANQTTHPATFTLTLSPLSSPLQLHVNDTPPSPETEETRNFGKVIPVKREPENADKDEKRSKESGGILIKS